MVFDVLAAIGLKETGSYVAKEVLLPLLQGSLEDYAKDFFKGCVADAVGLASQEPVQKALGKALKKFVELVEEELEFQGCTGAEIRDFYEIPLREFMKDQDVKVTLGRAFEPDCRRIEADVLEQRWQDLSLKALPEEFDWLQIGKQYVREIKGLLRSSEELRDLLKLHNQEAMRQGIEELVGIPADFDLRKYQETLREQYGNLKLESLDTTGYAYNDLKLWRMFIPQDVRTCQEFNPKVYEIPKEKLKELQQRGELDAEALEAAQIESYRQTYVEQPIENVLAVVGRTTGVGQWSRPVADYAVVLGDPGSGKSTLLQYVALQWAEQPIRDLAELTQRPLPLLIELRKYARDRNDKKCSSIVEYLHQGDIACRLNQQRLHEVLTAGQAVALFDGIDEVFDPKLREVVVTDIHRFTNNYSQVQVVVTSRWLGYKAQTLRDAGFQHYMLQDLTDEQIAEFIQRWHDQTFPEGADKVRKRERLHKAIRESKAIRELAGNPLLLTMMAVLNRHQELPRDRPELYNQASRVLLHQWDVERNLIEERLDPITIDYADKQAMLRKIADHMQSRKESLAGNIISAQDLEAILREHLESMEVEQPRVVAKLMIKQLRERNFILCFLGADNYAFVHRTFLEYFAAWSFIWKFEKTQELSFEELLTKTFDEHWYEESWHEVLRLIAGMIDQSFLERIVDYLFSQNGESIFLRPGNQFANIFLAADCYFESRGRTSLSKIEIELKKKLSELIPYIFRSGNITYYGMGMKAVTYTAKFLEKKPETLNYLKRVFKDDSKGFVSLAVFEAVHNDYRDASDFLPWLDEVLTNPKEFQFEELVFTIFSHVQNGSITASKSWLEAHTKSNFHPKVRQAAIPVLAQSFKDDPETLPWLKTRAQSDKPYDVRQAAVQALATGFKDDPETLPWLKTRAQSDKPYDVRQAAVQALATGFKDDPTLFEFWCDRILSDPFEREYDWQDNPRQIALNVLVQQYPDHPKTLELLGDRAQNDNDEQLRQWAAKQLEKLECGSRNAEVGN